MGIIWVLIALCVLVLVLLVLWLRERRNARIEHVAYGLREGEDSDEQTRTSITEMEAEFVEAISKLEELNLVKQDEWGHWIWIETGKPLGNDEKQG